MNNVKFEINNINRVYDKEILEIELKVERIGIKKLCIGYTISRCRLTSHHGTPCRMRRPVKLVEIVYRVHDCLIF